MENYRERARLERWFRFKSPIVNACARDERAPSIRAWIDGIAGDHEMDTMTFAGLLAGGVLDSGPAGGRMLSR